MDGYTDLDRVTVAEAALRLGVKEQAIRKRIQRGTLAHEKAEDGRVYVYIDAEAEDEVQGTSTRADTHLEALVESLQEQNRFLREELARKDAIMLNLTEAMKALSPPEPGLTQEKPMQEQPEAPVTPTPQPGRDRPQTEVEGAQEPAESPEMAKDEQQGRGPLTHDEGPPAQAEGAEPRVPWWRRLFGG
jgi:hypothetical protein